MRDRYWEARSKEEKSLILDEYCANTGQARKYAIRKLGSRENPDQALKKRRKSVYDGEVMAVLAKMWEIFDYPCGQRLKPLIPSQTDRLRQFGELPISDEVASKLKRMSPATIDRKLKCQDQCFWALKEIRKRCPFAWKGLDADNGQEFINQTLYKYCDREKLQFTRSRPGHKNDNAYIEEKNWTHVRKVLGYLRYDTAAETTIIRDLYRHELRLYKNFFQPVMKLLSKERIGGKIKRRYGVPLTPYQNLLQSKQLSQEDAQRLTETYLPLNPATLKRAIDAKINKLIETYEAKNRTTGADLHRKLDPRMVTSFMMQ